MSMDNRERLFREALELHKKHRGKLSVESRIPVETMKDLSLVYTPGVAEPCREIERNPDAIYDVTSKWNMVAVVTDGTAVLGLGDIGPDAALPVMEGKCVLFKRFAGIDAFPICVNSKDPDVIVETVALIASSFGGINLEDISAPRCFDVEKKLQAKLDIPVFHDDQHGTAVITLAGILNALKLTGRKLSDVSVVMNGAGAAGTAICRFLLAAGAGEVVLCDRAGAIYEGRPEHMNPAKEDIAKVTNRQKKKGSLSDVIKGAHIFLGISGPGLVTKAMVRSMAPDPIIFAMANPTPEIFPEEAKEAGASVVATGRSDYPNQINNCLGFPGIFRGALDVRATCVNEAMKIAAAKALAELVTDDELTPEYIIPGALDPRVVPAVAEGVARAGKESGVTK